MIDIMYILNFPKSNRAAVARSLYKGEPLEEFAAKVACVSKYAPGCDRWESWVPGMKLLTSRKEKEIEKQYDRLQMSEEEKKRVDEEKRADKFHDKLNSFETLEEENDYIDRHKDDYEIYRKYYEN